MQPKTITDYLEIKRRVDINIKHGCKKPVCYMLAMVDEHGRLRTISGFGPFWVKKKANIVLRLLKSVLGDHFVVTEAWIRKDCTSKPVHDMKVSIPASNRSQRKE